MFRKMLGFIFAALLLYFLAPAITPAALAANEEFVVIDGNLVGYNGSGGDVVIPDGPTGILVDAFSKNTSITSITIPNSVTTIGPFAFTDCTSLRSVSIPDSVTEIYSGAFSNCTSLESVNIPIGVTYIGSNLFIDCKSLTSINIPDGVTNIGNYAFYLCTSLESVNIPVGVTSIGDWAFRDCIALKSITIPAGITSIGSYAFQSTQLNSITFEGRHTVIGSNTFSGAPNTMLIKGYIGSTAHLFAINNGYPFEPLDNDSGDWSAEALIVPSDNIGIFINLTEESITLDGFTVVAYSIDGGSKWKKGALPTGTKFSKLFDKETTLWLCSEVDKKKKPTESAVIVKFPTISARPKTEKLSPYFTETNWFLVKKGSEEKITNGYEFAYTSDKKTAKDGKWYTLDENGFQIGTGKAKTTHLIRSPAKKDGATYTPASKIVKVIPANYGKAPNTKIKSKTKILKLKKGHIFQIDDGPINEVTDKYHEVDFNVYMGEVVAIWKAATGKKPPTEKQKIILNRNG